MILELRTYCVKCLFPYRKNCVDEMDCPMMLNSMALASETRRIVASTNKRNELERPLFDFDSIRLVCSASSVMMGHAVASL